MKYSVSEQFTEMLKINIFLLSMMFPSNVFAVYRGLMPDLCAFVSLPSCSMLVLNFTVCGPK